MSLALNKMAVWLATLVVAGLMLFVSSAAQAHVAHGGATVATPVLIQASAGQAIDPDLPVRAAELQAKDAEVRISESGTRTNDKRSNVEMSCCGTAVSSCSSSALVQAAPALQLTAAIMKAAPLGSPALLGVTVDGLIRPPRAAV